MQNPLKSRKFYAALVGLLVVFFGERGGVDEVGLIGAVVLVASYILGTAIEDGLRAR